MKRKQSAATPQPIVKSDAATGTSNAPLDAGQKEADMCQQAAITNRILVMSDHEKVSAAYLNIDHAHAGFITSSIFLAALSQAPLTRGLTKMKKLQMFSELNPTGDGKVTQRQFETFYEVMNLMLACYLL